MTFNCSLSSIHTVELTFYFIEKELGGKEVEITILTSKNCLGVTIKHNSEVVERKAYFKISATC